MHRSKNLGVGHGGFPAGYWLDDRRGSHVERVVLDKERATQLEGAGHVQDVGGQKSVVDVGEIEIEVAGVHECEQGRELVDAHVRHRYWGGTYRIIFVTNNLFYNLSWGRTYAVLINIILMDRFYCFFLYFSKFILFFFFPKTSRQRQLLIFQCAKQILCIH